MNDLLLTTKEKSVPTPFGQLLNLAEKLKLHPKSKNTKTKEEESHQNTTLTFLKEYKLNKITKHLQQKQRSSVIFYPQTFWNVFTRRVG